MPKWTKDEDDQLIQFIRSGLSYSECAVRMQCSRNRIRDRWRRHLAEKTELFPTLTQPKILPSPHPIYDSPLQMEGNVTILPDVEVPYHHAEFVEKVLELSLAWGVMNLIAAGDFLHFDSLSGFNPNWTYDDESDGPGLSQELSVARVVAKQISDCFDKIIYVLGNHEGRLLRAIRTPLAPAELLRLLDANNKWKIAPYYCAIAFNYGEKYRIEHPTSSTLMGASKLASKLHCHIIQGHSHLWNVGFDPSSDYWTIHTGCCVDERRLPYVGQRSSPSQPHSLGATIIYEGYPYVLHPKSDWTRLKKMVVK